MRLCGTGRMHLLSGRPACVLGVLWVYSGCTVGVLWVYCGCTVDVLWVYGGCAVILRPLVVTLPHEYSAPAPPHLELRGL